MRGINPKNPLKMTEAQFIEWSSVERRGEWINGKVILLDDVNFDHATLQGFLLHVIGMFVEEYDLGHLWMMPFQLRLGKQRSRRLPDIFFTSHLKLCQVERTQFNGSPDLVVEIVSADSQSRDRREKFLEYEKAGICEYWLVDSVCRTFEMYSLTSDGKYRLVNAVRKVTYSVVLPGLFFHADWLTASELPKFSAILAALRRQRKKRSGQCLSKR